MVHTHDPLCTLDHYQSTGLIILRRRDVFAAVMSTCLVWLTGQTHDYEKKIINPVEISEQDFIDHLAQQITYRSSHDFSRPYGAIYDFDFEDFVGNHQLVINCLGLHQDPTLRNLKQLNNPAPYNYKEVVKNHESLFKLFKSLSLDLLENPFSNTYGKEHADYN